MCRKQTVAEAFGEQRVSETDLEAKGIKAGCFEAGTKVR